MKNNIPANIQTPGLEISAGQILNLNFNTEDHNNPLQSGLKKENIKGPIIKPPSNPSRIPVRYRNHEGDITKYLEAAKVSYIEAFGSSVKFYMTDGTMMVSGKNLGYYEKSIVTLFGFIKIGRSYIVNPKEIDSFNNSEGYLILKSPPKGPNIKPYKLQVSREARSELMEAVRLL